LDLATVLATLCKFRASQRSLKQKRSANRTTAARGKLRAASNDERKANMEKAEELATHYANGIFTALIYLEKCLVPTMS